MMWDLQMSNLALLKLRELRTRLSEPQLINWFLDDLIEGVYYNQQRIDLENFHVTTLCSLFNSHLESLCQELNGQTIYFDCFGEYHIRVKYQRPDAIMMQDMGNGEFRPFIPTHPRDFNYWLYKTLEPIIEHHGHS